MPSLDNLKLEFLKSELVVLRRAMVSQEKLVRQSKETLDAALANMATTLAISVDKRLRRQTAALATTQAAIAEIERMVAAGNSAQVDAFGTPDGPGAPASGNVDFHGDRVPTDGKMESREDKDAVSEVNRHRRR